MDTHPKRILCLIDSLASGGAQRQIVGLAALLKRKGYEVIIVTYHNIPFYLPQLQENGVNHEYVSCRRGLVERLYKIGHAIKQFAPNVVISYLDTPNILACLLHITNRKKWKLIVSERNTTQRITLKEHIKFSLYRFADYIVPNSYSQVDFISKHYPQYSGKCRVITNFVDTDAFNLTENQERHDVLRIIGVGRILAQKNIPILIKALNIVRKQGKLARVDWYGTKFDTYEECMNLIRQFNLEDSFEFHESCNDIIPKYQESDLFVLPSIYEGFPNVLCEAMSCGLPVIATDVCDNGRIVRHEENGYLIPSGNVEQLAKRILQFMELSKENRITMSEKSREIAVEMFSQNVFIKKYIKLIG